jgi:hypothetical protein
LLITTAFSGPTDIENVIALHPIVYPAVGGRGTPPAAAGVCAKLILVIPQIVVNILNWYSTPAAEYWKGELLVSIRVMGGDVLNGALTATIE